MGELGFDEEEVTIFSNAIINQHNTVAWSSIDEFKELFYNKKTKKYTVSNDRINELWLQFGGQGYGDFAHMSFTIATLLYDKTSLISEFGARYYTGIYSAKKSAGYVGDVYGTNNANPSINKEIAHNFLNHIINKKTIGNYIMNKKRKISLLITAMVPAIFLIWLTVGVFNAINYLYAKDILSQMIYLYKYNVVWKYDDQEQGTHWQYYMQTTGGHQVTNGRDNSFGFMETKYYNITLSLSPDKINYRESWKKRGIIITY